MNTREYGRLGETSAAEFLEAEGYTVIARNVQVGHDEIDILAEKDGYIIFAEVKTRRQTPDSITPFGTPAAAVNDKKQNNLIRAADGYIAANPTDRSPRIDVVEVYADPSSDEYKVLEIRHYENAVKRRGRFSRNPRRK